MNAWKACSRDASWFKASAMQVLVENSKEIQKAKASGEHEVDFIDLASREIESGLVRKGTEKGTEKGPKGRGAC